MEHFVDRLRSAEINIDGYVLRFEKMLVQDDFGGSVAYAIEKSFSFWPHNHGYLSFKDFRKQVGIQDIVQKAKLTNEKITKEEFVYYLEYLLNILQIPAYGIDPFLQFSEDRGIRQILYRVLDELNCEVISTNEGFYLVQKNSQIELAREIVDAKYDLDKDLYLYTHNSNKKNLTQKTDILCRVYKYIESIAPQAKQYGHASLLDDIKDLSNKLDIRHAPTEKQDKIIGDMDAAEYEAWLDEIFRLSVTLIILVDYAKKRKDIKELKSKLG